MKEPFHKKSRATLKKLQELAKKYEVDVRKTGPGEYQCHTCFLRNAQAFIRSLEEDYHIFKGQAGSFSIG